MKAIFEAILFVAIASGLLTYGGMKLIEWIECSR